MVNKQALFAYYLQSGHKDCAKYVAEICQQLLQISASHLILKRVSEIEEKKSDFKLRLQNRIR
jgi:hypothetical protein